MTMNKGPNIDNREGLGATGYNGNIDYRGLRIMMKPSTFLRLARALGRDHSDFIENYIREGGAIGSPFLIVALPASWDENDFSTPATVIGHEGRNRMMAIKAVYGDEPIEVHLIVNGEFRARHFTPDIIKNLIAGMEEEGTRIYARGPLFAVKGQINEGKMETDDLRQKAEDAQAAWDSWYEENWRPLQNKLARGTPNEKRKARLAMQSLSDTFEELSSTARNAMDRWQRRISAQERLEKMKTATRKDDEHQLDLFNEDAEVLSFKPKKRFLRHLIEIIHFPNRRLPWAMFVKGQHFNSYATREEANEKALAKEKELDRAMSNSGWDRTEVIPYADGREWYVLDRGVVVGVYSTKEAAIAKADQINPQVPGYPKHDHWLVD